MSTHPNAILQFSLTPNALARKTYRGVVDEYCEAKYEDSHFEIGTDLFHVLIIEDEDGYDKDGQVGGKEGDILIYSHITYGYGETISWEELIKLKEEAESVVKEICDKFNCSYQVFITANYW